jgi:hypothetical protein
MTASHLLTLCFVLTAHGSDFDQPLGIYSASAHEESMNVSAYSVASWAQLVTACAVPLGMSANITLSPAFKMGAYTNEIDFRLVLYTWLSELETVP